MPSDASNSSTTISRGFARVIITARVWGWTFLSIKNTASSLPLYERLVKVIASAADVPSSSIDAFAIGSAVKSQTAV